MGFAQPTKKWGDVRAHVVRTFGDESGVQVEEGDLTRWINQAQYEIARQNKVLKAKGTTSTLPGQDTYALSVDMNVPILQIESVRYGDTRLIPTDFTTVDANLEEYPSDAKGDPRIWYRWGDEIVLWPSPKASETLSIYFTKAPAAHPTMDPDRLLELPDEYYLPILDFCMARAHEMDENPQAQEISARQYADRLAVMNTEERGGQSLSFSTINIVD